MSQRIVPSLWFNRCAVEAAEFYTSVFPRSRIIRVSHYPTEGLPDFQASFAGEPLTVDFELAGYRFVGINAGPEFPINSSVSFMLNFDPAFDPDAAANLDHTWAALADGGDVLMPLDAYPFSRRYGWLQDRYGVTWQLILTDPAGEPRPFIIPSLLFGAAAQNRAEEAARSYVDVFGGRLGTLVPYDEPTGPASADALQFADFEIAGQWFVAMDSGVGQDASFTNGVSLIVECADQAEIDHYWERLCAEPSQCGWCTDRFGLSWQIMPAHMGELSPAGYRALLGMQKIVLADLAL